MLALLVCTATTYLQGAESGTPEPDSPSARKKSSDSLTGIEHETPPPGVLPKETGEEGEAKASSRRSSTGSLIAEAAVLVVTATASESGSPEDDKTNSRRSSTGSASFENVANTIVDTAEDVVEEARGRCLALQRGWRRLRNGMRNLNCRKHRNDAADRTIVVYESPMYDDPNPSHIPTDSGDKAKKDSVPDDADE